MAVVERVLAGWRDIKVHKSYFLSLPQSVLLALLTNSSESSSRYEVDDIMFIHVSSLSEEPKE